MLNFISTIKCIRQLVEVSRLYGNDKSFVLGSGGDTSFKDDKFMWIKASGTMLSGISEESFVVLDRARLQQLVVKKYRNFPDERERQIRKDLLRSCVYPEQNLQPSVETLFHEIINYNFVVHTHPTLVNALMCSHDAEIHTQRLFGSEALFVPYTNPGYMLFKAVEAHILRYREKVGADPHIIFLQNHGVFVAADSIDEVREWYNQIITTIQLQDLPLLDTTQLPVTDIIVDIIPALRLLLTENTPKTIVTRHHSLAKIFYDNAGVFENATNPLTPEAVLYCNAWPVYIGNTTSAEDAVKEIVIKVRDYERLYNSRPKIFLLKDIGILSVADNYKLAEIAMDVFEDQMKVSVLSESFGGPRFLSDDEIDYIKRQAMDNIQRLLQKQEIDSVAGKTAAYIGNVRPLATGILENMMHKNMNLVIAADDEEKSGELVGVLNTGARENHAVKTSVNNNDFNLLTDTVKSFGGLDLLILTVDKPELCPNMLADGIAKLLKLQAAHKKSYFTDIILLCSLQDVNKSAANPFGAELPELALTLAPYNIKVNSIVIYDVESVYEKTNVAAIPMKRYTKADDLLKAMYYLIDQQCETGQTLYVTGGLHLMFR